MLERLKIISREPIQITESGFALGSAVFLSEVVLEFDEPNKTLYLKAGYRLSILHKEVEVGYANENLRVTVPKTLLKHIGIDF